MITRSHRNILVATLCLCVGIGPLVPLAVRAEEVRSGRSDAAPGKRRFQFEKVDLELLEQVNLVDRRFEREGIVLEDEATNAYLDRIGKVLIPKGLKLENVTWRFRAARDPQPNAFALPNGSIYVTTGLLALLDNESQLAAILAHELTHVMRRHTYLQNRSNRKKFLTMNIMTAVGAYAPGGLVGTMIMIASAAAPFLVLATMFGYSRELEREADLKGIDMMISAEYPPEEMVRALQLLTNDLEGEQIKLFYNDHPELQERIKYLSSYLALGPTKLPPRWNCIARKMPICRRPNPSCATTFSWPSTQVAFARRFIWL
jgi:predicted Zn-dependent protease